MPHHSFFEPDHKQLAVIVRAGCVFRRYRIFQSPDQVEEDLSTALRGSDMQVYLVDPQQPQPPEEGKPVDPVALGWASKHEKAKRPRRWLG